MTWVAWRQFRTEIFIALAILAGLSAYLIPTGFEKYDLFRNSGLEACVNAGQACPDLRDSFTNGYNSVNAIIGWFNFAPGIVGILLAAPIVTEFEQRTYRLAWTQSITRKQWLTSKLAFAIGGALVFALLLTALMTWFHAPLDRSQSLAGKDLGLSYNFEGVVPFAYTLFGLSLAVAAGALSRRTIVAFSVAALGFVVMRLVFETLLRQGFSSDVSFEAPGGELAIGEETRDMTRFWRTQAIESAIFVSASVALLALTAWVVRRRMS